jgi:hypothetical protein
VSVSFALAQHGGKANKGSEMGYTTPAIEDYGTLTEMTAAQADGNLTDRDFPVNTPKKDLTFSD